LQWLSDLLHKGSLSANETKKIWRTNKQKLLLQWQKENFIKINTDISKDTIKRKTETCVRRTKSFNEKNNLLKGDISLTFEPFVFFIVPVEVFHNTNITQCVRFGNK